MNLQKYIDDKYISVRKHPTEDLHIYDYTEKCQYNKVWTEETMMCRGLIMNGKGDIVARPFKKFFNLQEEKNLPAEDFEVYEKYDGSLGILYFVGDTPYLSTRGSFESDQAKKGTEILRKKYNHFKFNPNYTYLFEILYKENRIVVDYGGIEDLVLLAIIHTQSGEEVSIEDHRDIFTTAKKYDGIRDLSKLKELEEGNKEGFVVRFSSGKRIKVKFDEYVRLHRLITGINARHIWENLKEGKSIDELIEKVPDEFYKWVKETSSNLNNEYEIIEQVICKEIYDRVKNIPTRKEQAFVILQDDEDKKYSAVVFKMLDGQDYKETIWKMIKPKHEVPFKKDI